MTQNDGSQKQLCLKKASDVRIQRHVKILGTANPFDSRHEEYFEKRTALKMADRLSGRRKLLAIWQRQKGRCPICCERITTDTGWDLHHILQKVDGGSDASSNLVCSTLCAIGRDIALVLHLYCRSGLTTRLHVIQAECLEKGSLGL
jgi:hypothetical protein